MLSLTCDSPDRDLHSFPTRRSSDLSSRIRCKKRRQAALLLKPNNVVIFAIASQGGNREDHHVRSEEHTSELQSRLHLVCRLLLEKKKKTLHIENHDDIDAIIDTSMH